MRVARLHALATWTQGKTIAELEENLRDLYNELASGSIPGVRRVAELQIQDAESAMAKSK